MYSESVVVQSVRGLDSQACTWTKLLPNSGWNVLGHVVPTLVALASMPFLIKELGVERFGVLTLAWNIVGYFGVFDLGLGRALTKVVAERGGVGDVEGTRAIVQSTLLSMLALGVTAGALCAALSPWFVYKVAAIGYSLKPETVNTFYLLSASIPVVILTAGMRAVLEGRNRFVVANAIRIASGVFTFVSPFAVLPFSNSLVPLVALLIGGRTAVAIGHLWACSDLIPGLTNLWCWNSKAVMSVARFGGWVAISNIVGGVTANMERIVISATISMTALSYFNTPAEIVSKAGILSVAISTALFPLMVRVVLRHKAEAAELFESGAKYLFLALFPTILITVTFVEIGLTAWLGSSFATAATRVAQILTVSVFVNSFNQIAQTATQATGRSDIAAKLQILEIPVQICLVWLLTTRFGVTGAAVAQLIRFTIEFSVLIWAACKLLDTGHLLFVRLTTIMGISMALLALPIFIDALPWRLMYSSTILALFFVFCWRGFLNPEERSAFVTRFMRYVG